mgnify:CR=1 FL=1
MDIKHSSILHLPLSKVNYINDINVTDKNITPKELYPIKLENKYFHQNKCCERCGQNIIWCNCFNITSHNK